MTKDQLYVCNQADNPLCPGCNEGIPHQMYQNLRASELNKCTSWSECYDRNGEVLTFKVRCIKVKGIKK